MINVVLVSPFHMSVSLSVHQSFHLVAYLCPHRSDYIMIIDKVILNIVRIFYLYVTQSSEFFIYKKILVYM